MTDRAGQLWEHGSLRYLVLERVTRDNDDGYSWLALRMHDHPDPFDNRGLTSLLAEEFFTDQEWWRRVA